MAKSGTLRVRIVGDSGPLENTLGGMGGKLARFGAVAATAMAGVGAVMVGAAAQGVRAFAGLERGMNEVFTLLPGISQSAMDDMTEQVREFSRDFGVLPDQVVPALYQALSAGVPQDNVFDFMEIATRAAIGGVVDLETATSAITGVVNAYGDDVIDAGRASDIMFKTVASGVTTFGELAGSLYNVLPTSSALGVTFEDVSAAMATMTKQNIPTSVATTSLRQLFVELSKEGGKAADMFEDMAGQTFQEFIEEGGNTADALDIMRDAAHENDLSLQDMFGSVEAGAGALALAGDDTDEFRDNLREMEDSAGATEDAFNTMDDGLSRTWDRLKVQFNDLLIELGERIAPALQTFADWFEQNMPAIIDWFVRMGDRVAEFGRQVVSWWQDTVRPKLEEFMAAVRDNKDEFESIWNSLGRIVEALGRIFSAEMSAMSSDSDESTGSITDNVNALAGTMERFAATAARIAEIVAGAWNILAGLMKGDLDQITRGLDDVSGGAFSRFADRARNLRDIVIGTFRAWGRDVQERLGNLVQWFRDLPGRIVKAFGNVSGLLRSAGRDLIRGFIGGIGDMAGAAARKAREVARGAVDGVKGFLGIRSPSRVFMEIGEQSGQGLVEGLEHMLRQVADAGAAVGAAAVPDMSSGTFPRAGSLARSSGSSEPVRPTLGPVNVRVFVGDRELTDLVRVELDQHDREVRMERVAG